MTTTEALSILKAMPRPTTFMDFTFRDFDGVTKHGDARVEHRQDGVFLIGTFGCGKTRASVHDALREYLSGRELLRHHHHD
jgi:predicted ATPase